MKHTRAIAMLLALLMVLALAACQADPVPQATNTTAPASATPGQQPDPMIVDPPEDEPALGEIVDGVYRYYDTVDIGALMRYNSASLPDPTVCWLFEWARQEMNINFTIEGVPNESVAERTNLMFAAHDYPEVLLNWGHSINNLSGQAQYGDLEGQLLPVNDYMNNPEIMPNVYQYITVELADLLPLVMTLEGNIYAIPGVPQSSEYAVNMAFQPFWYDGATLDALNVEPPKTLDEFYTVLKRIKEEDPKGLGKDNNIPLGYAQSSYVGGTPILNALGFVTRAADAIPVIKNGDYKTGELVAMQTDPAYFEYLSYMAKLFDEGLVDPDMYTMDGAQCNAKLSADYYSFIASYNCNNMPEETWQNWYVMEPMTSALNDKQLQTSSAGIWTNYTFFNTDKSTPLQMEATMRFVDMGYDREFRHVFYRGPRIGIDDGYGLLTGWEMSDDGSTYVYPDVESGKFSSEPVYLWHVGPVMVTGNILDRRTDGSETKLFNSDTRGNKMNYEIFNKCTPYLIAGFPGALFDSATTVRVSDMTTVLKDHIDTETAKFITGQRAVTQEEFDKFVNELKGLNIEEYMTLHVENLNQRFR